ncbi:hypothetical protein B0E45_07820 [Sinorhizobium sp. A49]|uniref:SWIM zinc finger family protein n=1 Tax=Sinorhizobium sp. A49 TaxID=1945861 RepID=UPI000985783B|nr:SWIM zinc finger family protein [Sinorhizobium sp. A49]OOG72892.1 hypothetical protein B0E45_07820 [Sinorhizobium sp. A49]
MVAPAFTEDVVRALASAESFARGRHCLRIGAVSKLTRRGDFMAAQVEGSSFVPYEVTIELHHKGVTATRCSCPYEWGGTCKHVVAVLLKYIEAPGEIVVRPAPEEIIRGLDREALADLLIRRAAQDPGLVTWLEAELATGAPGTAEGSARRTAVEREPIRRQAEALLSGRHSTRKAWDYVDPVADENGFAALLEKARPFLEVGDGRNALNILEPAGEALVAAWSEQADWDETLHELFPALGQMFAEAALMADLSPEERDDLMVRLDVWQGMLDEYGLDGHLQVGIDALEQGWDEIGLKEVLAGEGSTWPILGKSDWTGERLTEARLRVLDTGGQVEAFLNLARAAGLHGDFTAMQIRQGRIADAIAHAQARFRSSGEAFNLCRLLKERGHIEAALELAHWGLTLNQDHDRSYETIILARWLRETAGLLGARDLALAAARAAFEASLSLEDFRKAETLAGPDWRDLRARLLQGLMTADHSHDRIEILLEEGMIDEAVRATETREMHLYGSSEILLRLAGAAHASHLEWVIEITERMATDIVEAGRSGQYELAARWLEKAALAYDAAGRFEEWTEKLDALIQRHRRKHKLRPLLKALRGAPPVILIGDP